jgi:hypothetical protein
MQADIVSAHVKNPLLIKNFFGSTKNIVDYCYQNLRL